MQNCNCQSCLAKIRLSIQRRKLGKKNPTGLLVLKQNCSSSRSSTRGSRSYYCIVITLHCTICTTSYCFYCIALPVLCCITLSSFCIVLCFIALHIYFLYHCPRGGAGASFSTSSIHIFWKF